MSRLVLHILAAKGLPSRYPTPTGVSSTSDPATASFLHSPVELPRSLILRRIAAYVRTGGHLLVVSHAAPPPWFDVDQHPGHRFIGPDQDFAEMSLPEGEWRVTVAETRSRIATGPAGEEAELLDGVLLLQRQR